MTLLDALGTSPRTKRELASKLGIPTREVEALVQSYRLDGAAIWSDSDGYRFCRDAAEADTMYERLRDRLRTQGRTAWAMRRTARRMAAREHRRPEWPTWDAAS